MIKLKVILNGVDTEVDRDLIPTDETGRHIEFLKDSIVDGMYEVDTEVYGALIEAKRIKDIKVKAGDIILEAYPAFKQTNAQLGVYGQEYLDAMKLFIADIIKQSNDLEVLGTSNDFVIGVWNVLNIFE